MKYRPGLPGKNENVSHDNPLGEFALLCIGLAFLFIVIYWILGLLVDLAADRISHETEAALFNSISKHLEFELEQDQKEFDRVQVLINDLQSCTKLPYKVTVHIVNSEEANAIALPGGHIAVFTGLLKAVPNENGLAFVLAHELGHFENRDHLRALGRSLVLYSLSALITGGNSSISGLLAPSFTLTEAQYSQARESLADTKALDTLYCNYGDVHGATDFFNYILSLDNPADIRVLHYFSSHPDTRKRIKNLKEYAEAQGYISSDGGGTGG